MRIRHIGHAGFVVHTNGMRVLIDPWFSTAFLGTWRPQPDNSHLRAEIVADEYDLVHVSHGHQDHFDVSFLRELGSKNALCAKWLEADLAALGFWTVTWPGMTVIQDDHRQDAMLLIDDGATRVLFANDTNVGPAEWPGGIDILACQFSGASYYPTAYDYPPSVMARKVEEARETQLNMLVSKVKLCGARRYIPCAGPAKIAGVADGPGTAFPHWNEIADAFAERCPNVEVCVLQPGEWLDDWAVTVTHGNTTFTMPRSVSEAIEAGECTWEEALLSMKIRLHREPDVYDRPMMEKLRGRQPA